MLVKEVRHFGVTVDNLVDAVETFIMMGFIVYDKGTASGEFARKLTGHKTKIEWYKMEHPDSFDKIELVTYTPKINVDFHIALTVKDIGQFGVKTYAVDKAGRKIRYVKYGGLTLEVVQ